MQMRGFVLALLATALPSVQGVVAFRGLRTQPKTPAQTHEVSTQQVEALHKKLETVAHGLEGMLKSGSGAFGKSQVAPMVTMFLKELQTTLSDTKNAQNATAAWQKLQAAQVSVSGLGRDLESRQESLMREDEAQRESLLLGVLMTRKSESMSKQLEVLASKDFAELPVALELKKHHDDKLPLFEQVASYLDAHHKTTNSTGSAGAAKAFSKAETVAASLQKRVDALQHEFDVRAQVHSHKQAKIQDAMKKAPEGVKKALRSMLKKEERTYKKWAAMRQHDIQAMATAVSAVKKGDMSALNTARASLMDSLKALKAQSGGFLYLIQVGATLEERDCPYCAAQCVDTCHGEGKPYAICLAQCADAGKGF